MKIPRTSVFEREREEENKGICREEKLKEMEMEGVHQVGIVHFMLK